jgi:hypothetical protein
MNGTGGDIDGEQFESTTDRIEARGLRAKANEREMITTRREKT